MDNINESMETLVDEAELERQMEAQLADFAEVAVAAAAQQAGLAPAAGERPLTALYELMLPITIELGRTRLSVQEVLQLSRGSVIELERLAGEPVDIFVGDRRFAEGEVVVLGENFGVRITRLVPPSGAAEAA